MKKLLAGLVVAGALATAVPAQAAPHTVLGSFVSSEIKASQPHRLYFTITAGHGAKTCDVTLIKTAESVDLGTDKQGSGVILFLRARRARVALALAQAAPSPTRRIVCSH